ncbi:DUF4333 domain-containing protein [Tumidithrix helvetica PCC 7403]|uniref:DUF4333 domain-containing protein n=1 Tax=Tumidithrix helvetica TaxID=3457545 RepID=UPI003C80B65F
MRKSVFLVGISIGIASIVTACSTTLDIDKLKASIKDGIKDQMGITVQSVTCPEKREAKANDSFECTAAAEKDSTITVTVKQSNDKGDVNWEVASAKGVVDLTKTQKVIVDALKAQTGIDGTVDCGGKFKVVKAGETFECKGTDAKGNSGTIEVKAKDDAGNIEWHLKR